MRSVVVTVSGRRSRRTVSGLAFWTKIYLRRAAVADLATAAVCSTLALQLRFDGHITSEYPLLSLTFPMLWVAVLWLFGAYDDRFIGTGSDEFRKVLNAGVSLTAGLAILSYAVNTELSRAYLLLTMPSVTALDLIARRAMRKRLHKQRAAGRCMSTVLAVGHEPTVADLIIELRRDTFHGLTVVATCLTGKARGPEVAGVLVLGGLDGVASALRQLAWEPADPLEDGSRDPQRFRCVLIVTTSRQFA